MTIRQIGGVFGRHPKFEDVEIGNVFIDGNTVTVLDTNGDLILRGNGTGLVQIPSDVDLNQGVKGVLKLSGDSYKIEGGNTFGDIRMTFPRLRFFEGANLVGQFDSDNFTVNRGNVVIGTSGKGIDFSATSGTGTSELFDDYEEGTFTATLTPNTSGTITPDSFDSLAYTKVGRQVTITGQVGVASVASPVGTYFDLNLPFAIGGLTDLAERSSGAAFDVNNSVLLPMRTVSGSAIRVYVDCSTIATGRAFVFSFTYFTD